MKHLHEEYERQLEFSFHLPSFWREQQIIKEKARWRTGFWRFSSNTTNIFCFSGSSGSHICQEHVQSWCLFYPQTWQKIWVMLFIFRSRVMILLSVIWVKESAYFSPCRTSSPARFYSSPTVHGCSLLACLEPSLNEAASRSEEKGKVLIGIKQLNRETVLNTSVWLSAVGLPGSFQQVWGWSRPATWTAWCPADLGLHSHPSCTLSLAPPSSSLSVAELHNTEHNSTEAGT